MLVPLCFVLFSNTVYKHQHLLPDGRRIEHAHPFQSCPDTPDHQHTTRDILMYSIINDSPVIMAGLSLFLITCPVAECILHYTYSGCEAFNGLVLYKLLRAPPGKPIAA
jgi:hypothetical protein